MRGAHAGLFVAAMFVGLVGPGRVVAGPDLSRTETEGGAAYHPDSRERDLRYHVPTNVRLAADDKGRRVIGLYKYNRPKPVDDPNAGRLQGGYLRLGLESVGPGRGYRDSPLVWRGSSVKLGEVVTRSGEEYPPGAGGWADLPLTRDQLDPVWGDFETAPPVLVRIRCGVVYAGEWPVPADLRGDLRIDRAKAAAAFRTLAGKQGVIRAAEAERFVERCVSGETITPSPKDPPREWKLAVFAQIRADMLRYAVGTGELEGETCCECLAASGIREVRVTEWMRGERAVVLAVDLGGEPGKKARVREEVNFAFDGTPRRQRFMFTAGTDLGRLAVERVIVEATYKEPGDKVALTKLLTLTPKEPTAEWSLQTRAPAEAVAEYRVFVFVAGSLEPLRSRAVRINAGGFNFSVPRHEAAVGEIVHSLIQSRTRK
ncbi:MAG TPA: hypothetical protein VH092_31135 [Urbifossiella sp.]|nr:hypothetical protein [Urbifossiella sp.]